MNRRLERFLPPLSTLIIFVLVATALVWTARRNYREFVAAQHAATQRSAAAASREIGLLISDQQRGLRLLIDEHPAQLQRLSRVPDDPSARRALEGPLRRDFPGFRALLVTDPKGRLAGPTDRLGAACRADLRAFAAGRRERSIFFHRGPTAGHLDLMVPWTTQGHERGVVLVRFSPVVVAERLRPIQLSGHRLVLVRDDRPARIEITAGATAGSPTRLSAAELGRVAGSARIPATPWRVVDLPQPDLFAARAARERQQILIALSGIGALSFLLIALLRRKDVQRLKVEAALLESHRQLERRVSGRTRALRESNEGLECEIGERRHAEWLRSGHQEFLRLIARGRPLPETLDHLARYVEEQFPDVRCTFMVRDEKGDMLRLVAAPSLPAAFKAEFSWVRIGEPGPVCAVAAARGEPAVIEDVHTDAAAGPMRTALEAAGLLSAWAQPVFDGNARVLGTIGLFYTTARQPSAAEREVMAILVDVADIAIERCRAESQMRKLSRAMEQTDDVVVITDRNGVIEYVNPAFLATSGYSRDEVIGATPAINKSGLHESEFYRGMWQTILRGDVFRDVLINRRRDGSLYYEEKTITPIKDEAGNVTHFVSTGKDITERMEAQEHLHYLAHHDVLTGLPNRALLQDRLGHAIAQSERSGKRLAVLFFDLDRFKNVNDSLGHGTGDELLKAVVERVAACVRGGDTVARLSGDEFTIVMEGIDELDDVSAVADKVLTAVRTPTVAAGHEVLVTASVGISIYPDDAVDIDSLLKYADSAMYRAKESGGNCYQYFTPDMTAHAVEYLKLQSQIHQALERGEFVLHFQPRIDLHEGRVSGVEALLRWDHPEFGLVEPKQFIPLLEETGLIVDVGEWVLTNACRFSRRLSEVAGPSVRVAVNLSTRQFRDRNLIDKVRRCLEEDELEPERLEVEITESLLADHLEQTTDTLRALHAMGVGISVDDFGTGYSSMSYLKRFPIGRLKIDRSFVRDVPGDENDSGIILAIIALARSLRMEVTAEGVETEEQLEFARRHGCDEVQGYLLGRPMPPAELLTWLRAHVGAAVPPSATAS
ncbi:MAG TPA: EAL domain-containing protein [Gammaproteobacteria bacterium]|nr:EAL domain-containing protein [Gammaproteobacteria bacterium]